MLTTEDSLLGKRTSLLLRRMLNHTLLVTGQKPSHLIMGSRPSLLLRVKWHTLLREARHSMLVKGGRYKLVRGLELISVARIPLQGGS